MAPDPSTTTIDTLAAYLWDLRAQAEAKLRCLTRLQRMLDDYARRADDVKPPERRDEILKDLTDLVTISGHLQRVSTDALKAARELQ